MLGTEAGVYALFLRDASAIPEITPGPNGLIYIGLAANRNGLKGRCHFNARTRNHSPRKSLAVLLMEELGLVPILVTKPNSADTWGLDVASEARLSDWMHHNLDLAVEPCRNPDARESELVARYAPPLNLTKCVQSDQHRRISESRKRVQASVSANGQITDQTASRRANAQSNGRRGPVGAEFDTANAIAARFGLNEKSYRQQLRNSIAWYRKPQDWTFPVDSREWRDMIAVAERMGRSD
ncbi:MAG: hypothetical protein WC692_12660 [Erythrobacter sp.]